MGAKTPWWWGDGSYFIWRVIYNFVKLMTKDVLKWIIKNLSRSVPGDYHIGLYGKTDLSSIQIEDRSYILGYHPLYCKFSIYRFYHRIKYE